MFGRNHYVPVLKGRDGEYGALQTLTPSTRQALTPLVEIPPIPWDFKEEKPAKTIDGHLKLRRSPRMTHLCSSKVTHPKNTIWRRARREQVVSSTLKACKAFVSDRRRAQAIVPGPALLAQAKPGLRRPTSGSFLVSKPGSFLASAEGISHRIRRGLLLRDFIPVF